LFDDGCRLEGTVANKHDLMQKISVHLTKKGVIINK
jgi:hypothetical protein